MTEPEIVFIAEADPEGGFIARAIGESIFTQADTRRQLSAMIRDAVDCHFEPHERPRTIRLRWQ